MLRALLIGIVTLVAAGPALAAADIGTLPLSALTLVTPRPPALVLGYAGHSEAAIGRAVERMAAVLDRKPAVHRQPP